jgi:hypothetical protein
MSPDFVLRLSQAVVASTDLHSIGSYLHSGAYHWLLLAVASPRLRSSLIHSILKFVLGCSLFKFGNVHCRSFTYYQVW